MTREKMLPISLASTSVCDERVKLDMLVGRFGGNKTFSGWRGLGMALALCWLGVSALCWFGVSALRWRGVSALCWLGVSVLRWFGVSALRWLARWRAVKQTRLRWKGAEAGYSMRLGRLIRLQLW